MIRLPPFLKITLLLAFLAAVQQTPAGAADIVAVQSAGLSAYTHALEGFTNVLLQDVPSCGPKSVQAHSLTSYTLSETESPSQLRNKIIQTQPDLLLVIGSSSLSLVKNITNIPIIYLLVPYPELMMSTQDNITGINIQISAEQQLKALVAVVPHTKHIGLLYDPQQTGDFVEEAQDIATRNNIILRAMPVHSSSEVPGQLNALTGTIDSFWMLPDKTVLTPQTVDFIFLYSLENRIPILTFSKKYLDMGALLSVSFDPLDMGKQAGELALKILQDTTTLPVPPQRPRKVFVHTNNAAAKILKITPGKKE